MRPALTLISLTALATAQVASFQCETQSDHHRPDVPASAAHVSMEAQEHSEHERPAHGHSEGSESTCPLMTACGAAVTVAALTTTEAVATGIDVAQRRPIDLLTGRVVVLEPPPPRPLV